MQRPRSPLTVGERAAAGVRRLSLARPLAPALAFALLLVLYGNGVSALPQGLRQDYDWALILVNLALMLLALLWAWGREKLSLADIGFVRRQAVRGALIGLALAAAVISPVVLYFLFPFGVREGAIDYERAQELSLGGFLLWALVKQPIGTSLFEETVFRGILQALMIRAQGVVRGILATAGTFALWHLVINFRTIQETNVGESAGLAALAALAQLASLLGLFVGGVFMGLLRQGTGSLAAPIAFHWLVVVAMNGTLFALSR